MERGPPEGDPERIEGPERAEQGRAIVLAAPQGAEGPGRQFPLEEPGQVPTLSGAPILRSAAITESASHIAIAPESALKLSRK